MKSKWYLSVLACCLGLIAFAGGPRTGYTVKIDLTKVKNDMLDVELIVPSVNEETVRYNMPKIVPGTYAIYDFGRFVNGFRAYDSLGNELLTKSISENIWEIYSAKKLYKISYQVEDTYDTKKDNKIFEPAGTNIEEGKNFVLNNFGFFGYLKGMKDAPYSINVTRPEGFFGGTSLNKAPSSGNTDVFVAKNYFEAHDCPIMYCKPDTAMMRVGNADVLVSVYSPNQKLTANDVRNMVSETMDAQRKYLGGTLPTEKYSILIYLFEGQSASGGAGALEHQTSTMFNLPEQDAAALEQTIKDVTAHEFFHIVTPLNVHSQHIHDYDFINPQMSKHLWMYEGVTEYSAQHVQVKYGLLTQQEFLDVMKQKMTVADFFNDTLPFTEMSLGALDEHESQYSNVYQKGALIGMCLDIKLRDLSDGEYGIQDLMQDLSKKYGKNNYFEDENLFKEIVGFTYPEIDDFLKTYVDGNKKLPFKEVFETVGISYEREKDVQRLTLFNGRPAINYDQGEDRIFLMSTLNLSEFGKSLKLKDNDYILQINGEEVNAATAQRLFGELTNTPEGEKVKITVGRKDKEGILKPKTLKGKAKLESVKEKHSMKINDNASERQKKIRKAWLEV